LHRSSTNRSKPAEDLQKPADIGPWSVVNAARGRVRAGVERVFAVQKDQMGLFIRTIGLDRARTKIGLANLTYNLKRFVWFERRAAMA
jgi:hypothetical protein